MRLAIILRTREVPEMKPWDHQYYLADTFKNIFDALAYYSVDEYGKDKRIMEAFVRANKPILGICGGEQYLNVLFGGTMCQRVQGHVLNQKTHTIEVKTDSFLYEVYGERAEVNSYHKQCVEDVAPGFRITAKAEDGVIEGIERDNIIGVQWHPEAAYEMDFFVKYLKRFFTEEQLKGTRIIL